MPHPALDQAIEPEDPPRSGLDPIVFGLAALVSIAFVVWGLVGTDSLSTASGHALDWVMTNTGWLFVLVTSGFVVFVVWLAISKYGTIPLGRDDEEPEFKTVSWIAMMFSAGMGIGLMFYGVSEPLSHFATPPPGTEGDPDAKVQTAMATTMFHWTLHPWAIYAVVGLAIAYGVYRKGRVQADLRGVRAAARQARLGRRGPADRHVRHLRDALRLGHLPGPGRAADQQWPGDRR
ncbi:BCCT family transporter [Nocardioides convexus]|uniref:BCCT family transporter n=1 Tax=Nocardioides convexus TaxID=2712224 RepID=UPI002418487F|nr:BCCT family transporter [Nocardioides convexus]